MDAQPVAGTFLPGTHILTPPHPPQSAEKVLIDQGEGGEEDPRRVEGKERKSTSPGWVGTWMGRGRRDLSEGQHPCLQRPRPVRSLLGPGETSNPNEQGSAMGTGHSKCDLCLAVQEGTGMH